MKRNGGRIHSVMIVSRRIACRRNSSVIVIHSMQTCISTQNGILKTEKRNHARIMGEGNVLGIILECGYSFTK